MTIRELVQYQQNNRQTQSTSAAPRRANGSLPPEGHVNPYGVEGMDITGTTSADRKIIPVDEGVANKLKDIAMQIMAEGNGIDTGFGVNETIKAHVITLAPEKRVDTAYTLTQIFHQEAVRLGEYVHQRDPSWNWGEPFDKSILEDYQRGVDITV